MNVQLESKLADIIRNPYVFQLILDEDAEQDIYEEFDIDTTKDTLGKFNRKLVTVISVRKINDVFHVLFKHGGEIIGWTAVGNSHYVYPKQMEPAKVSLETFTPHEFNRKVMGTMDMMIEFRGRLFSSKAFVDIEGEKLELLFMKGNLRGIVKSEDLQKGRVMHKSCTIGAAMPRYRDSNLSVELPAKEEDFDGQITLYFPELNLLKLQHGNSVSWMRADDLGHDFTEDEMVELPLREDAHQYYIDERQKTKAVIDALLRRQIRLENEADNAKNRLKRIETLYRNLRASKLGKIQVKIWERRKRRGK